MVNKNKLPFPLFVKLCSDRASFETRTRQRLSLSMNEVRRRLEQSQKHEILVYTPHMIILRSGRAETTLSRDGRMLIKKVANEAEATNVAGRILRIVLKDSL